MTYCFLFHCSIHDGNEKAKTPKGADRDGHCFMFPWRCQARSLATATKRAIDRCIRLCKKTSLDFLVDDDVWADDEFVDASELLKRQP
jgi:hypothetical protein